MKVGDLVKSNVPSWTGSEAFVKVGIIYEKSGSAVKVLLPDGLLNASLESHWENISKYE